ncbi:MAG: lipoprotein signal peptidase [Epsilonproteobacteria bacterium]|nr:lipoprotein signal peptidase [Campylobacterota bacterium]
MVRYITIFLLVTIGTVIIDQNIKMLFVDGGYYLQGSCIDLELHYNKGVAFSMFAFLGDNLKWIQLALIFGIIGFVIYEGYLKKYAFAIGLIIGGAISNLYDRFVHEGVVDYVAWHCGFDFAVFNYADVMIDLGVAIILLMSFLDSRKKSN